MSDHDYEIQLLNGRLFINGLEVQDYLDCIDRRYSVTTSAARNAELHRIMRLAFTAGQESLRATRGSEGSEFRPVPLVGDVD